MLRQAYFIASKELKYTIRAKETIFWVFFMPIVFFFFIGTVTSGFGPSPDRKDNIAVWTTDASNLLMDQLTLRLEEAGYNVVRADSMSQFEAYARRLIVPDGFTDSVLAGHPVTLSFARSDDNIAGDYDVFRVQRAAYTVLADLIVAGEIGEALTPETFTQLNDMPRAVRLEVVPAGERQHIPSGFEQAIPGIMVMFTLLVMATSGSVLLVIERRQGLLRRLAYTPIPRLGIVLGKWSGKVAVGLVQIAFAMLAGTVLFKMDWGPNLATIIILMAAYAAMMAALGVVLGSLARTEGQAIAIGVIAANVLAALGGCWWPIEIAPGWVQKLQLFLPTGWAMDALHRLISFAQGPASVVPHITAMVLATAVLVGIGTRVFRFE